MLSTFESVDHKNFILMCRYIFGISRSCLCVKVIGSRSRSQEFQSIHRHQTLPRYLTAVSAIRLLRPNVTSSIKPEVRNILQRRQRRTEPRPQGICTKNFVTIGPVVAEICCRTDRRTHRQTDRRVNHNTLHPYRGGVVKSY